MIKKNSISFNEFIILLSSPNSLCNTEEVEITEVELKVIPESIFLRIIEIYENKKTHVKKELIENLKLHISNKAKNIETIVQHKVFLDYYSNLIKNYSLSERIEKFVLLYPQSDRYFKLLKESKVFCTAPWLGLNIHPEGKVFPCCAFDQNQPIGHLKEDALNQIRENQKIKDLKENILADKKISGCQSCYLSDAAGGENLKTHLKNIHEKYIPLFSLSNNLPLVYLDVQFSNLCNLRCRICGPVFSSSWISDHKALFNSSDQSYKINAIKKDFPEKWNSILSVIENVDEVYFWGGEPLMMPEHNEFLKKLIEQNKNEVQLRYSTNFSNLEIGQFNTIELWKKFKNLSIGASLDGSYERGEFMRKGIEWKKVIENRKLLAKEVPHARFFIACATSAYNIFHISDFFQEWVQLGYIKPNDFCVNLVYEPRKLSVQNLPQSYKDQVSLKINKMIEEFLIPQFGKETVAENRFRAAVQYMNSSKSNYLDDFLKYNIRLDELRSEKMYDVFPELKDLQ